MLCKVTHCIARILANTSPHQLHWAGWELEAVSYAHNAYFHPLTGAAEKVRQTR